jgi:hypothetical protein
LSKRPHPIPQHSPLRLDSLLERNQRRGLRGRKPQRADDFAQDQQLALAPKHVTQAPRAPRGIGLQRRYQQVHQIVL